MTTEHAIADGLQQLGFALPPALPARLAAYLRLLEQWNRAYNLTAVREPAQMVPRHLLDSLSVLPWLRGASLLDVGSGAGLPGIPLALARPDLAVTLLDGNGKRSRFMTQAVLELGLDNVTVVQARVEDWHAPAPFACVISRAFAALAEFVEVAGRHCAADGHLLAMKGQLAADELAAVPAAWSIAGVHRLTVPGLEGEQRHLVELVATRPAAAAAP